MPDPASVRPAICLNMIVRNEAHVIVETFDSVAPYITSWVIVDTGSEDGTQDLIREHMTRLGISGELYQRPWRNFGANRTEALALAQGHGDYIWVMDADDILVGAPEFNRLDADIYLMRIGQGSFTYWRPQLFRDGARVHYQGVVHEGIFTQGTYIQVRLPGDYYIDSRRLGARSQDPQKYARDRDLLLAEVDRNPEDTRSVSYLAQSYFDLGDFVGARRWYARRAEMGGWDQEVYYALWRVAESMARLDEPWPAVQDAYLKAWDFRPRRAEPLHALAHRYRIEGRYRLGYLFARLAAEIPLPDDDVFLFAEVYAWRAVDEQAICAFYIGKQVEAFALCRRLLARSDLPAGDRQRIASNRDFSVPAMIVAASSYPESVVGGLVADAREAAVTLSLVAGLDRAVTEATLNSFLHCCTDVSRVRRFLVADAGLSAQDRAALGERYGFVEFIDCDLGDGPGAELARLRTQIHTRFWLHLRRGWRFFAPENLITRLTAVLYAEPQVFAVGVNFGDAVKPTGACAAEEVVRRDPGAGRYVLTNSVASGPAMFDTARLDRVDKRAAATGLHTASLDEVFCTNTT